MKNIPHSAYDTVAMRVRMAQELFKRLKVVKFDYFVTLATNHRPMPEQAMRRVLKDWDAYVNRWLVGPDWHTKLDERMIWFAFLEKPEFNPHWHLVVQLDPAPQNDTARDRQNKFDTKCEAEWLRRVPSGSVDVQRIDSEGVIRYCHKDLWRAESFEAFIACQEFWPN